MFNTDELAEEKEIFTEDGSEDWFDSEGSSEEWFDSEDFNLPESENDF